jgi:DNA-binding transcriptional ArsR family regulator
MPDDPIDAGLQKALGHPLRLRLLEAIIDGPEVSPVQLHRRLGVPLATVSRHIRVLRDLGYVELTRTAPRRGAVEHFYRAVKVPFIDNAEWQRLPLALRRGMARQTFRKVFEEASEAGAAGGFDPPDAGVARVPLEIDEIGQRELTEAVYELIRQAEAIRERSDVRRVSRSGSSGPVSSTCLAILHFWVDDAASSSARGKERRKPKPPRPRFP